MPAPKLNRRQFMRLGATLAAGAPLAVRYGGLAAAGAEPGAITTPISASLRANARVAITDRKSVV